jgi:hypothetical protein
LGRLFELVSLLWTFLLLMAGIVALYIAAAEIAKRTFYRNTRF